MPKGIEVTNTDAEGIDLYVNYEGLEGLRDNTTREYSQWFADIVTRIDEEQFVKQESVPRPEPIIEQDPLPGL
jgi:hypothetical protein